MVSETSFHWAVLSFVPVWDAGGKLLVPCTGGAVLKLLSRHREKLIASHLRGPAWVLLVSLVSWFPLFFLLGLLPLSYSERWASQLRPCSLNSHCWWGIFLKYFIFNYIYFVTHTHWSKDNLRSLFPPTINVLGMELRVQAWQQVPFPTEPSWCVFIADRMAGIWVQWRCLPLTQGRRSF